MAEPVVWLEVTKAIATVGATLVAAWWARKIGTSQRDIAAQQARTASAQAETSKAKLNLDLFELRYELFEKVWGFLSEPIQNDGKNLMHPEFTNLIPKARFLFGDDIADFMKEASQNRSELALLQHRIAQNLKPHDEADTRRVAFLQTWFFDEASRCHDRFGEFLDFSSWRADPLERIFRARKGGGSVRVS